MEVSKNNFIIIGAETDKKGKLNDGGFFVQERIDDNGKPGKVQKFMDGEGDVSQITERFIKEGFDPKKILINGQPASDALELTPKDLKDIKRAKIRLGSIGYAKLGKYSDDDVAEMNKTGRLAGDYKLIFRPKLNYYYNFMPAGSEPAHFQLTKASKNQIKFWNGRDIKFTNKIPKDYEIVNQNGKTYLKEKNVNVKEAKKDMAKSAITSFATLAGVFTIVALVCGAIGKHDTAKLKNIPH